MNNQPPTQQFIDHLTNLIRYQLDAKSTMKGAQQLEVVSNFLRTNAFKFKQYLPDIYLRAKVDRPQQYPQFYQSLVNLTKHLQSIDKGRTYTLPDILQQHYALKTAGISIGQTNALYLQKVIKSLAIDYDTKQIRFWGKILGYRDYYVIQGVSSKKYLNQLSASSQPYGVGINTYSYWVSTNILDDWVQLPLVTSEQVVASRQFKYIFSGDLNKKITYPNFKGQEKHLLKCVVARITHSCQLTPKGLYKLNEQNPTIVEFEEQFKCPQTAQMNALDTWVHKNAHILSQGRATYYIDPSLSQQQKQALNTELAEKDPIVQRFKGIAQDKPYETLGFTANWSIQLQGQSVPVAGKAQGTSNIYGVVLLKNLTWPGACTVGYKGAWCNIYIGYGHRISQQNVFLTNIKELLSEGQDQNERSQPNPAKAPEPEKKQQVNPDEPPAEE